MNIRHLVELFVIRHKRVKKKMSSILKTQKRLDKVLEKIDKNIQHYTEFLDEMKENIVGNNGQRLLDEWINLRKYFTKYKYLHMVENIHGLHFVCCPWSWPHVQNGPDTCECSHLTCKLRNLLTDMEYDI